ncbi:MAG: hypothetical protein DMG76_20885 [Acidobacteria bacterium]|jgi:hypothetical protein|nr:MAG: hypothetical protein DMG76_20885 [Acidobacteriota bacterium]
MNLQQPRFRVRGHRERQSLPWAAARLAAFSLAALPLLASGNPRASDPQSDNALPAAVQHVKLMLENGAPALEIVTTAPVKPQISTVNGMRLVIDLPNTNMSVPDKLVPIKHRDFSALRLNLLNTTPPVVHVEVDFRKPLGFTWDSAGNRLLFSFHHIARTDAPPLPPLAPSESLLPVSAPVDAANFTNLVPEERVASGASITADSETTVLRLKHAGDVYVCPQTTISVLHSRKGPDLMLALNDGALETHLTLQKSADEVVTPDFRILLRGPGEFHYAIRADSRGNTCVRTLPGNTASAIIYELMGDGTFQVQAHDQLVFHEGKLSPGDAAFHAESKNLAGTVLPVECGCPPPSRQTLVASNTPDHRIVAGNSSPDESAPVEGRPDSGPALAKDPVSAGSPVPPHTEAEIPDLPESLRQQPHLEVDASLTFTPNSARATARNLPVSSRQLSSPIAAMPPPPPPVAVTAPERRKTVLGKIKTFFSRMFH